MRLFVCFFIAIVLATCSGDSSDYRFYKFYVSFFSVSMERGEEDAYNSIDSLITYHNISPKEYVVFRDQMVEYPEKWNEFLENLKVWIEEKTAILDSLDALEAKQDEGLIIMYSDEELNRKARDAFNKNENLREYILKRKKEDDNDSGNRFEKQKGSETKTRPQRRPNRVFR